MANIMNWKPVTDVYKRQIQDKTPTSVEKSFDAGNATVTVTADGVQTNITVHVADYAQKYADDKILQYINENIAGKNLSDMELMKKIAAYPASFDYGASHSGYVSMICLLYTSLYSCTYLCTSAKLVRYHSFSAFNNI